MISIFEVFAQNRSELDFIENLEVYGQIVTDKEEEGDLSNPLMKPLYEVRDQLSLEEFEWAREKVKEGFKKLSMVIKVFELNHDKTDFIHSIKRLAKNMNKK